MSLASMFATGLACARAELTVWAFMGDGASCMNPGMLMVERHMKNLANLTHILVSNRVYGATSNAALPNACLNDYAAIARAMGIGRVFTFDSIDGLRRGLERDAADNCKGYRFIVLEVEPFSETEQKLEQPPFEDPELKYRFGRHIEARTGCDIFGYRLQNNA